jgi:predicted DNA-binding transcriptional regulator AlpA
MSNERELLIPADRVASMMNISTRTLWRLLSAKSFLKPVRIGGSVRWRLEEVERWVSEGCPELAGGDNSTERK